MDGNDNVCTVDNLESLPAVMVCCAGVCMITHRSSQEHVLDYADLHRFHTLA